MANKGLANQPGENNCFLNSAVQVLWHVDVFRESLNQLSGHRCTRLTDGGACVFCALKVTFTQFSYSSMKTLQPDVLRQALAEAYMQEQRFQLGSMDDATECLENILQRLHVHLTEDNGDDCFAQHCISHQKFGMTIMEKTTCTCGANMTARPYTQLVHYVAIESFLEQARLLKQQTTSGVFRSHMFGHAIQLASTAGELKTCSRGCGKASTVSRMLTTTPDVLTIGLAWNSSRSKPETLSEFMNCVGTSIKLADLFDSVSDPLKAQTPMQLTAVVCYYGKHYSTFCYGDQHWVLYDDATVKQIGRSWQSVVGSCTRGPLQPLLLIYTCVNSQVVDTRTALTTTVPLQSVPELRPPRPPKPSTVSKVRADHRHTLSGPAKASTAPVPASGPSVRKLSKELEQFMVLKAKPPPHPRNAPPLPPKQSGGIVHSQTIPRTRHEASTSFSGDSVAPEKPSVPVSSSSSLGPGDYINRGKVATVMQAQKEALLRQQQKINRGRKAASVTSGDSGYDGSSSYASSVTGTNHDDSPSLMDIPDDESCCSTATSPCFADDEGFSDYSRQVSPRLPMASESPGAVLATLPRTHRVGAPVPIHPNTVATMTRSYTGGGSSWSLTASPDPTGARLQQQQAKSVPNVTVFDSCPRCGSADGWSNDSGSCINCGHVARGPPPVPPPQHAKPTLMTSNGHTMARHNRRRNLHLRGGGFGGLGGLGSGAVSCGSSSDFQPSLQPCRLCNKAPVASPTSDFCDKCGQYMARFGQV